MTISHIGDVAVVALVVDALNFPVASDTLLTDAPESAAVEYELAQYPIQMTEERQKQERRVTM